MQAGRGCRHRARGTGIYGLVALPVEGGIGPVNIGWQRHVAMPFQQFQHRPLAGERQQEQILPASFHPGPHPTFQQQLDTGSGGLAGAHMGEYAVFVQQPLDQHLDPAATAHLVAEQACGNHPGVVEHQQIAGLQQFHQIGEAPVMAVPIRGKVQQPAGAAPVGGLVGDPVGGERVLEVAAKHGAAW